MLNNNVHFKTRSMKILFIDDEEDILFLVKKFLSRNGYTVDVEASGRKGLVNALVNKYDVILLDLNLNDSNGIDICKKLRTDGITTPIIFITSSKEDEFLIKAFRSGADDYLKKPFNYNELLVRIEAILRRPKIPSNSQLKVKDLLLDKNTKRLYYKESFINLTKKEFSLVEFLMRNNDKIITREDILENVWDINANPFSNIVEAFIKKIRKKIREVSPDEEFIHNIKGIGYYVGDRPELKRDSFMEK